MLKPGTWSRPIPASPIRSRVLVAPLITHDAIIKHIFFFAFYLVYKRIILQQTYFYHINKYLLNVNTEIEHKYFIQCKCGILPYKHDLLQHK